MHESQLVIECSKNRNKNEVSKTTLQREMHGRQDIRLTSDK